MYQLVREEGSGFSCIPLNMDAVVFSCVNHLASWEMVHKAMFLAQFWLPFPLRFLSNWTGTWPWSTNRPKYYQRVADFIARKPWCLEQSVIF